MTENPVNTLDKGVPATLDPVVIESIVLNGDLKGLNPDQKVAYYNYRCQQSGLDPAAKPFDLLSLNGKLILYANASCTQQLTNIHNLSHTITHREVVEGTYCVFCRVTGPDGRSTENMGAAPIEGLKGEARANTFLKATTKAIRRAVLAHCGLGMMDVIEVETIPNAQRKHWEAPGSSDGVRPTDDTPKAPPADPGADAAPADPQEAWTDEEVEQAILSIGDFADALYAFEFSEEAVHEIISKPRDTIGNPDIPPSIWKNRYLAYSQRQFAKLAKHEGESHE